MKILFSTILVSLFFVSPVFSNKANRTGVDPDIILRNAFLAQVSRKYNLAIKLYDNYFQLSGKESAYIRSQFAIVLSYRGHHKRAINQAGKAIKLSPNSSSSLIVLVRVLRRARKHQKALHILESSLEKYGNNSKIEFYIAELYYDLTRYRKAKVHYKQVLFHINRADSRGPEYRNISLWKLARIYLHEKDFERSRLYFVRYIRHNPHRLYARYILGYYLYFRQGDFFRASQELELISRYNIRYIRSRKINPYKIYLALGQIYFLYNDHRASLFLKRAMKGSKSVLGRALLYSLQGKDKLSFKYLYPYLKQNPADLIGRVALVRLLDRIGKTELLSLELIKTSALAGKIGRYRLGIELSRKALILKKKNPGLNISNSLINQQIAGHYDMMKQPRRTVVYLRNAVTQGDTEKRWKNWKQRAKLLLNLSRLLASSSIKQYDDALSICNSILKKSDNYGWGYYSRGQVFLKKKELEKAISDFTRAIELEKEQYYFYFFRAVAYRQKKDYEHTVKDLKKTLAIRKDFAQAKNFLGYIYAEKGVNTQEALELIKHAIHLSPTNGAYQDSLGWVYFRMGLFNKARYHLELAALLLEESSEEDPVVYDHIGDVYVKLKMPLKALIAYKRALAIINKKKRNNRLKGRDEVNNSEDMALKRKVQFKIKNLNNRKKS